MNLLIAESKGFSQRALDLLHARLRVQTGDLNRQQLLVSVAECDVLWVRLRHYIDAEILDAAPRMKAIATNTTGLNHIDTSETKQRGIDVLSLQGEVEFLRDIRATAELTLGLMLSLLRNIPAAVRHTAKGQWNRDAFCGHELHEKTVGIVGYGRLGRIVARYVHAFDARVLASTSPSPNGAADPFVEIVPFEELLRQSDIVSVHVDLSDQTRGMFSASAFAQMKDGARFINTARGEVVDESALRNALESGKLSGAALDVLADEQTLPDAKRPVVQYAQARDNLIVTPHIGGCTLESQEKTEMFLANKVVAWAQSHAAAIGTSQSRSIS